MEKKGIDVSKWQGTIDWNQVRQSGIEFAMIRAATGLTSDPNCEANLKGAEGAGLPVGLYLYSYALDVAQAEKEADFLLQTAEGHKISYPMAIDMEDKSQQQLTNAQRTEIALAFASKIREAGFVPMLYASKYWLENLFDRGRLGNVEIWVAQWGGQNSYNGSYGMWQYSNTGKVRGIGGNVDLDCACKDYPAMMAGEGWVRRGSRWYYGNCRDTWKKIDGRWYWFEPDGMAATGIQEVGGKWYVFADKSIGPVKECQCIYTDRDGAIV